MNELTIFAAGSLRNALPDVLAAFTRETGRTATVRHGPAGLLRERLEAGDAADLFASADLGHPQRLADQGLAGPVTLFARNTLHALVRSDAGITAENLVDKLLDPSVGIGTSTPLKDPSGDYAWKLFAALERIRPGAFAILDAKAQKLVGGSEPAPDRSSYGPVGTAFRERRVDVFLGYRTGMAALAAELPGTTILALPRPLVIGAPYGLTVLKAAPMETYRLASFMLSVPAQSLFAYHGFQPVALPDAPSI